MNKIVKALCTLVFVTSSANAGVGETLYLADSMLVGDGLTTLFQVDLNGSHADLTELASVPFEQGDAIAADINGSRIWLFDKAELGSGNFGYYDLTTDTFVDLGVLTADGDVLNGVVLSAISPEGTLYVVSTVSNSLYTVDTFNAEAHLISEFTDVSTGYTVIVNGGDISFTSDGTLYLVTNGDWVSTDMGVWEVDSLTAESTFIGDYITDSEWYTGLAIRNNGLGELVASTTESSVAVISQTDGSVLSWHDMYLSGNPYNYSFGDMTIGPMIQCTRTIGYWANHDWTNSITLNGEVVEQSEGQLALKGKSKDHSMLVGQLIAAELNCNDCVGMDIIDDAEAYLLENGITLANRSEPFVDKTQKAEAMALKDALDGWNNTFHCE